VSALVNLIVNFVALKFGIALVLHLCVMLLRCTKMVMAFYVSVKLKFLLAAELHVHYRPIVVHRIEIRFRLLNYRRWRVSSHYLLLKQDDFSFAVLNPV